MMRRSARAFFTLARIALAIGALSIGAASAQPAFPPDYQFRPMPLPFPGGHYSVGTRSFELSRADGTPLGGVAWYPAADKSAPLAPYFTDEEKRITSPSLSQIFAWPAGILNGFGNLRTNAHSNAPLARGRFPLVIFSHGFMLYPRQNSALMERLAAEGYIVLSIAHPGDAADQPSSRGPLPTRMTPPEPEPDPNAIEDFWTAPNREAQMKLLPALWRSPRMRQMEARQIVWREDLRIMADAALGSETTSSLQSISAAIEPKKLAFAGMSFGGSTSASACSRDPRCVAAINLDGIEFDRALYDHALGKPILLIQSDWVKHPNGGPMGRDFTSYDLAYERRATAGRNPDVYRYRLKDVTHMGMTDLILTRRDLQRDALLGTIDGARAVAAIGDLSVAFLDRYLKDCKVAIDAAAGIHPELVRHSAGGK